MPSDLEGQSEGRSSWARAGLQIATASSVEPRFQGVVTLELANVGTIPLRLYPGVRIAQMVFHETVSKVKVTKGQQRKYHGSIGPEFSRIHEDKDMAVFRESTDAGK